MFKVFLVSLISYLEDKYEKHLWLALSAQSHNDLDGYYYHRGYSDSFEHLITYLNKELPDS